MWIKVIEMTQTVNLWSTNYQLNRVTLLVYLFSVLLTWLANHKIKLMWWFEWMLYLTMWTIDLGLNAKIQNMNGKKKCHLKFWKVLKSIFEASFPIYNWMSSKEKKLKKRNAIQFRSMHSLLT